jgi:hypothetical protein
MTTIQHYHSENLDREDLITHLKDWFVSQDFDVQSLKMEDGVNRPGNRGGWLV